MLAYDYPMLSIFWTMFVFFMWFIWLLLLFRVFADIFRSHEMGGVAKALWTIFVIFAPFLGVLVYLIARGDAMAQHAAADAAAQEAAFSSYVKQAAGSTTGAGDQLTKLAALHDSGAISDEEYEAGKAKILAV